MTSRWFGALACALVVAQLAFPARDARAALFDDNEARQRIADTNARLAQIQRQLEDRIAALETQIKSQGLLELFNQVEQLKSDVARLRGQLDVVNYELEQSQKRQRDLYVDLDTRLRKLETAPQAGGGSDQVANAPPPTAAVPGAPGSAVPPTAGPAMPVARPSDPVAEQRAYDAALDQFKRGDYQGAITSFSTFVKNFPQSPLAPSAQYWVGNAYYARKDYRGAIAAQRQLIAAYPQTPRVADALLNIASAQSDLNDNAAARKTLEELIKQYPQTEAAAKAKQRLGMR